MRPPVHILHADDDVVAVDKPSGFVVHPGTRGAGSAMLAAVRDHVGRWVYPVHRLDRGTSGVLLFTFDGSTAGLLNGMLSRGETTKRYVALVRGVPDRSGTIDHAIARDGGPRVDARTSWRRLWVHGRYALVEAVPHTGRRHQIRRHLKHLTHPIIGDVRYGKGDHNRFFREQYGLFRLALHAASLGFEHPRTGARVVVRAPIPPDFAVPLLRMGAPYAVVCGACDGGETIVDS